RAPRAGFRLSGDAHLCAPLGEKWPKRFWGGRVSSTSSEGSGTPSSAAAPWSAVRMSDFSLASITGGLEPPLLRGRQGLRPPHRLDERGGVERLGDVLGHAQSVAAPAVLILGPGRERDDRDRRRGRVLAEPAADL